MKISDMNKNILDWIDSNNEAVKCLQSNASESRKNFEKLLTTLQSVPFQSMNVELELTVAVNLLISRLLSRYQDKFGPDSKLAVNSLTRIVKRITPSSSNLSTEIDLSDLMKSLFNCQLYLHVNKFSLGLILEIVCMQVILDYKDEKLVKYFLKWIKKMKICNREMKESYATYSNLLKVNVLQPTNLSRGDDNNSSIDILTLLISVKTDIKDTESDDLRCSGDSYGNYEILIRSAKYLREGNVSKLRECLECLCDPRTTVRQPEVTTIFCQLSKGEMLIQENKVNLAFGLFKQVIQQDPANIRAYVGIAKCFELLGKFRNELDTWKIICQVHHSHRNRAKSGETTKSELKSFAEVIIDLLFPFVPISLVTSLATWARKCHKLGEYEDSAEVFLDTLAVINNDGDGDDEDPVGVLQEAILAMMIVGKFDECKILCQQLLDSSNEMDHEKKRKSSERDYSKVISNYLAGKVYYFNEEYKAAMRYLDVSLQSCQVYSNDNQGRDKRRKIENLGDGDVIETDCDDIETVAKLRSRLYYEKSLIFSKLEDEKSQAAALKYSLRLHFDEYVNKIYCDTFSDGRQREKSVKESKFLTCDSNNICLKFLLDFSNIHMIENNVNAV